MKQLTPRIESVKAFYLLKGWALEDTTKGHFVMKPPAEFESPDFRLYLPRWEDGPHYRQIVTEILEDAARIYNWNHTLLVRLLSKSPKEFDKTLQKVLLKEQQEMEKKIDLAIAS